LTVPRRLLYTIRLYCWFDWCDWLRSRDLVWKRHKCGSSDHQLRISSNWVKGPIFFLALQPHDMLMIESGAAAAYVLDVPITTFKSR